MNAFDTNNLEKQVAMNNSYKYVSPKMDVQAAKLAPFIKA